ncbi:MAG: PAS domain-containing protein, partial [Deltaproteobacteria bacterium]|nr:PAS domain-containing protein [Deltaproteobacteria bacterium]
MNFYHTQQKNLFRVVLRGFHEKDNTAKPERFRDSSSKRPHVLQNKRITSFNRAAQTITGFKAGEAIGQYCFDVFRANICEKECALDETLTTCQSQVNLPALIISKTGDQKPISISTSILKNENGDIIGGVETFRDLSELERLKRQLARNYTHEDIVGRHPRMKKILSFLPDIAESESPVLIEGPT